MICWLVKAVPETPSSMSASAPRPPRRSVAALACQWKRMVQVASRRACSRKARAVSPPTVTPIRPSQSRMDRPSETSREPVSTAWV